MSSLAPTSQMMALDLAHPNMWPKQGRPNAMYDRLGVDPVSIKTPAKKMRRGAVAAIARAFDRLEEFYNEHVTYSLRKRVKWIADLLTKGHSLIHNIQKLFGKLLLPLISMLRNSSEAAVDSENKNSQYMKWLRRAKILAVISLPSVLYALVKNISSLSKAVFKKKNADSALEAGLMITNDVADLTVTVGSIIGGLQHFGLLAKSWVSAVTPYLGPIGTILSVASIALNTKHWGEGFLFRKRLVQKFRGSTGKEANFKDVVDFVNEKKPKDLQKKFDIEDGGELKVRLNAIWERNKQPTAESKKNINKAMSALKNRITWKNIGHALKVLAGTITIVAASILLFTSLAPVGHVLLATAAALSIFVLLSGKLASNRFNRTIKKLAPDVQKKVGSEKFDYDDYHIRQSIRDYKWKHGGRKAFRKKASPIIYWKPNKKSLPKGKKMDSTPAPVEEKKTLGQKPVNKDEYLHILNWSPKPWKDLQPKKRS